MTHAEVLPTSVVVKEVGPRDGLQNEPVFMSTEDKVEFVNRLSKTGLKHIEVSSFVHPKWIPSLADARDVFERIDRHPGVTYTALVPNQKGLEQALAARVDGVNVFMSASEAHNQKNLNRTISETLMILRDVVGEAKCSGLPVRGYVSTVFGCPYSGDVPVDQVIRIASELVDMGVDEISLGDTIGVAVPNQVSRVIENLSHEVDLTRVALHFHDTRGMAVANIYAGLQCGIRIFDSSVGGLGGCPYAPGASGNVATEDVLYLLHKMGIATDVQETGVLEVAEWLEGTLGKPVLSHGRAVCRG